MPISEIGAWLVQNPGFLKRLDDVTAASVAAELTPSLEISEELSSVSPDWQYLLLCAGFLATSPEGSSQSAALRIAQACLSSPETHSDRKDTAAYILNSLSNLPALRLAESRKMLEEGTIDRLPLPARMQWIRDVIGDSLSTTEGILRVNRFQKSFWTAVANSDWLSVSAPTSAGKSFIVCRWTVETIRRDDVVTIAYIVPTRALISQVERDFRKAIGAAGLLGVEVVSVPVPALMQKDKKHILVFTQERLNVLLTSDPHLKIDVVIVDEAHKIADRARGVLLQHVLERISFSNPGLKVILASPMTSNPELLVSDAPLGKTQLAITSEDVTVNQNLIWLKQKPRDPREWKASLILDDRSVDLGSIKLKNRPDKTSKRLPFVAVALANGGPGNVVYVNRAADAETAAIQIYDCLEDLPPSKELDDLIALSSETIHSKFLLPRILRRGVAFHYGNLPLILREEIERLFSIGLIRYLVCTSTLIEGVNMACRNVFVRGPRRGASERLTKEDFWNLAGRAGRWGKEFQGNHILCRCWR